METILLKDKKNRRHKVVKIIAACLIFLAIVIFIASIRIGYRYYKITPDLKKTNIGVSTDKYIRDKAEIERIEEIKAEGYDISNYQYDAIIDYKTIIIWRWTKNDNESILKAYKDSIYVMVYGMEVKIAGSKYLLTEAAANNLERKIHEINPEEEINITGTFINHKKILKDEDLEKIIENYQSTIDNN